MKIRDIKQYREAYIREEEPRDLQLGKNNELFREKVFGNFTEQNLRNHVKNIAKFAVNHHEQLIYELIQNAGDAHAKQVYIFYDEENFLFCNNGTAFNTSLEKREEPKGELFGFLAKGKSFHDKDDGGEHGQGSKILYQMIADVKDGHLPDEILKKETLKGVILYSWNRQESSIYSFLKQNIKEFSYQKLNEKPQVSPLFCKTVYTYFPALPYEKFRLLDSDAPIEVFTQKEIDKFKDFASKCYVKIENPSAFNQGTFMYVPLGKDRAKEFATYLDRIVTNLDITMHFVKNVDKIVIADLQSEKIFPVKEKDRFYVKQLEDSKVLFPKKVTEVDFNSINHKVNFFKHLPITNATYGLNFYVNNNSFEIKGDRQDFYNNNYKKVEDIGTTVQSFAEQASNDEFYRQFFLAVLSSKQPDLKDNDVGWSIAQQVYNAFFKAIENRIPSDTDILEKGQVKINNTGLDIKPEEWGIEDYRWIHEDLNFEACVKRLEENDLAESVSLTQMLDNANPEKLKTWINSIDKDTYQTFLQKSSNSKNTTAKVLKPAKGQKLYNAQEVLEAAEIFFITADFKPIQKILSKLTDGNTIDFAAIEGNIFGKGVGKYQKGCFDKFITLFNKKRDVLTHHDKNNILKFLQKNYGEDYKTEICEELEIFTNKKGEFVWLKRLIQDTSEIDQSIDWLNTYALNTAEASPNTKKYTCNPDEVWDLVINEKPWQSTIKNDKQAVIFYKDLRAIFNACSKNAADKESKLKGCEFIFIEGNFYDCDSVFWHKKVLQTDKKRHKVLKGILKQVGINIPSWNSMLALQNTLKIYPDDFNVSDIAESLDGQPIASEELSILYDIYGSSLFGSLSVYEEDEELYIVETGTQYYTTNKNEIAYLSQKQGYYLLPEQIKKQYQLSTGIDLSNLISDFGSDNNFQKAFIDSVYNASDIAIKQGFIDSIIASIDINSSDVEPYIGNIIEMATKIASFTGSDKAIIKLKNKISIDSDSLDKYEYTEAVLMPHYSSKKLKLSELLPQYKGKSDLLQKVIQELKDSSKFSDSEPKFFTLKDKPIADIDNEISHISHIDQLAFVVSYAIKNKQPIARSISNSFDLKTILNRFYELDLHGYTNTNYEIPNFYPKQYILASESEQKYLIHSEFLPKEADAWRLEKPKEADNRNDFLHKIGIDKKRQYLIAYRKDLLQGKADVKKIEDFVKKDSNYFANNTMKWAVAQKEFTPPTILSEKHKKAIQEFIDKQLDNKVLPEYLLEIAKFENSKFQYRLTVRSELKYFIVRSSNDSDKDLFWKGCTKHNLKFFDAKYSSHKEFLKQQGKVELETYKEFNTAMDKSEEWTHEGYKTWIKENKNAGYNIYLPGKKISYKYFLKSDVQGFSKEIESRNDENIGFNETEKNIFIHKNIIEVGNDPLNIIRQPEHKEKYKWFDTGVAKDALIDLALLVRSATHVEATPEHLAMAEQIQTMGIKPDILNLLGKLSPEDLKKLLELGTDKNGWGILNGIIGEYGGSGKDLQGLKEELEDSIEKNTTAIYRKIIGYVGEQIILQSLQHKHGADKVTLMSEKDNFAGYDLLLNIENKPSTYIEAKTTIGSFKSGENKQSVAFKLGRTQYELIMKEKTENFHVFRLSLEELDKGLVDEVRSKFKKYNEKGSTQELDISIKKEVESVVQNFFNRKGYDIVDNAQGNALLLFRISYSKLQKMTESSELLNSK
ncbi:MAG: hypothetical protein JJT94_00625 [Bernardetiaceae bacterium]|nr:hypothetical protein [Bernardetiaceae bacterium]